MKILAKISLFSLFLIFATACKTDPLENYFVKATESPDFFVVNIPASVVTFDEAKLDPETIKQIKSIRKMNILVYKNDYDLPTKNAEFAKADKIIKSKSYKTLTKIKNDGYEVVFSYQGAPEKIDEIIFLGKDKKSNFLIGMLKGNEVDINNLAKALKHIKNVDGSQAKSVFDMIKKNE